MFKRTGTAGSNRETGPVVPVPNWGIVADGSEPDRVVFLQGEGSVLIFGTVEPAV